MLKLSESDTGMLCLATLCLVELLFLFLKLELRGSPKVPDSNILASISKKKIMFRKANFYYSICGIPFFC